MSSPTSKYLKGGSILGIGQILGQACSLGRNIIIARAISQADFGIAAIFLTVVSLLEMISNLSLDRLLIQAPDGNNKELQDTAHFLQAMRGIISAILIVCLARPISILFNIPETSNSFYFLALIPLINGFIHIDPRRFERDMNFGPYTTIEVISQGLTLIMAWPATYFFPDYRAMLIILITKTLVLAGGSHLVAERHYRWNKTKHLIKRFVTFGWPLMINGILLFIILEGDKFIIGSAKTLFNANFSMADVGLYSTAFMVTMIPATMAAKIISSIMLPNLAKVSQIPKAFNKQYSTLAQWFTIICIMLPLGLIIMGPTTLTLFFGNKYALAGKYIPWLALMWTVRTFRSLLNQSAIAKGKTKIIMYSNIARLLTIPLSILFIILEKDIVFIAISAFAGECIALMSNLYFNQKYEVIKISFSIRPLTIITCLSITTVLINQLYTQNLNILFQGLTALILCVIYLSCIVLLFPNLKQTFLPTRIS